MRMLHAHYGEQVILLIDEYDVPLDKARINGYYDQMVAFLRSSSAKRSKPTRICSSRWWHGCLRISKESIFTRGSTTSRSMHRGYALWRRSSALRKRYRRVAGRLYGTSYALEDMRAWYDGYHFGNADVYCPWDVVNHCDKLLDNRKARPKPYWNNTSSNALVKQFIDMADATTRGEIEQLVAGKTIRKKMVETLTYGELTESIDNLWSVLFTTGYLTVDKKNAPKR